MKVPRGGGEIAQHKFAGGHCDIEGLLFAGGVPYASRPRTMIPQSKK